MNRKQCVLPLRRRWLFGRLVQLVVAHSAAAPPNPRRQRLLTLPLPLLPLLPLPLLPLLLLGIEGSRGRGRGRAGAGPLRDIWHDAACAGLARGRRLAPLADRRSRLGVAAEARQPARARCVAPCLPTTGA